MTIPITSRWITRGAAVRELQAEIRTGKDQIDAAAVAARIATGNSLYAAINDRRVRLPGSIPTYEREQAFLSRHVHGVAALAMMAGAGLIPALAGIPGVGLFQGSHVGALPFFVRELRGVETIATWLATGTRPAEDAVFPHTLWGGAGFLKKSDIVECFTAEDFVERWGAVVRAEQAAIAALPKWPLHDRVVRPLLDDNYRRAAQSVVERAHPHDDAHLNLIFDWRRKAHIPAIFAGAKAAGAAHLRERTFTVGIKE